MFYVFLSQIKTTYVSSCFPHWFDEPLPHRQIPEVGSCLLPITWPYHKCIMSDAPKCNDAQREGRRSLRLGVSVELMAGTSQIPQVDTFFLHMLNPMYTTPLLPLTLLVLPPNIFHSLLFASKSKASKNVFGTHRQTSRVYSTWCGTLSPLCVRSSTLIFNVPPPLPPFPSRVTNA